MSESDTPGLHPSIILKTNSQILKHLIKEKDFSVLFKVFSPDNYLMYGVQINDDSVGPAVVWSMVERQEELDSIYAFLSTLECPVYLYNEATANTGWSPVKFSSQQDSPIKLLAGVKLCPVKQIAKYESMVKEILFASGGQSQGFLKFTADDCSWSEVNNYYITNAGGHSRLSIMSGEEGSQQEEIGIWFLDSIAVKGAVKNPVVYESEKPRELSDIIANYPGGCFLVESKSLAVFARESLPDRNKLTRVVKKHLVKAISQLQGACRNIQSGCRVTDANGNDIEINRTSPIQCIVLVPDLSLLTDVLEFGEKFAKPFMKKTKSLLHVLDPSELRSCVSNALYLSKKSKRVIPSQAFDFVLLERFKHAYKATSPNFHFRIGMENNKSGKS